MTSKLLLSETRKVLDIDSFLEGRHTIEDFHQKGELSDMNDIISTTAPTSKVPRIRILVFLEQLLITKQSGFWRETSTFCEVDVTKKEAAERGQKRSDLSRRCHR